MRRCAAAVVTALILAAAPVPAHAYLKLGALINGTIVDVTWPGPVRYFVSDRDASVSAADLRGAVERAAATWSSVTTVSSRSGVAPA